MCRRISTFSEEPHCTTRRFLTPPVRQAHLLLSNRMEQLGMQVTIDAVGNLRGLLSATARPAKRLILGSHIDTVPAAGAFDGVLGVVLALELAEWARALSFPLDLEVIAFSDEEGVRFGVPFIGSRAVAGRLDSAVLDLIDADQISVRMAIENFGLDASKLADAVAGPDSLGFLELHIEQGPALEAEGLGIAAVSGIVGQSRLEFIFTGLANHAGTTPMHLRRDGLAGAAEWVTGVEALAQSRPGMVATVGRIGLQPNAANVIPGRAELTLDLRHADDSVRREAVTELLELAGSIASRRGLQFDSIRRVDEPSVPMDERLTNFLIDAMEEAGLPARSVPSGAGHDAMILAGRMPTAMLFVRSPGGISHHPDETVREEDVETAVEVGTKFLERLAHEFR